MCSVLDLVMSLSVCLENAALATFDSKSARTYKQRVHKDSKQGRLNGGNRPCQTSVLIHIRSQCQARWAAGYWATNQENMISLRWARSKQTEDS